MKIGLMLGSDRTSEGGIEFVTEFAQTAESKGFDSVWMGNFLGLDAIVAMALAGARTSRIELGTAVAPSYPKHPVAMAQQALSAAAACGDRFTLGVGLSHKRIIEDMLGIPFQKPAAHMSEYLQVLAPLLRGEPVDFSGQFYRSKVELEIRDVQAVPLILAALGPAMLRLAGTCADGTITWMTGRKTIAQHIVPAIRSAAEDSGKSAPRILCGLPVALTSRVESARESLAREMAFLGDMPSYRAMLDREGVKQPADIALLGDEADLRTALAGLRDAGVTDFCAAPVDLGDNDMERTIDFLSSELKRG